MRLAGIFKSTKYGFAGLEHHQYLDGFAALREKDQERLDKQQARMVEAYKVVKKGVGKDEKGSGRGPFKVSGSVGRTWADPAKLAGYSDDLRGPATFHTGECADHGERRSENARSGGAARFSADPGRRIRLPADHEGQRPRRAGAVAHGSEEPADGACDRESCLALALRARPGQHAK